MCDVKTIVWKSTLFVSLLLLGSEKSEYTAFDGKILCLTSDDVWRGRAGGGRGERGVLPGQPGLPRHLPLPPPLPRRLAAHGRGRAAMDARQQLGCSGKSAVCYSSVRQFSLVQRANQVLEPVADCLQCMVDHSQLVTCLVCLACLLHCLASLLLLPAAVSHTRPALLLPWLTLHALLLLLLTAVFTLTTFLTFFIGSYTIRTTELNCLKMLFVHLSLTVGQSHHVVAVVTGSRAAGGRHLPPGGRPHPRAQPHHLETRPGNLPSPHQTPAGLRLPADGVAGQREMKKPDFTAGTKLLTGNSVNAASLLCK